MHVFVAAIVLSLASVAFAGGVFYESGFDFDQGYTAGALDGQDGWAVVGSGAALVIDGVGPAPLTGQAVLLEPPAGPGAVSMTRTLPSEHGSISFDLRFDIPPGARGGNSDAELEILGPAEELIHAVRFASGAIELVTAGGLETIGNYSPGNVLSFRVDNDGDGQQRVHIDGQQVYAGVSLPVSLGGSEAPTSEFGFLVDGDLNATLDNVRFTGPIPSCDADLSGDGAVGSPDLAELLAAWGACHTGPADTVIEFEPSEGYVEGPLDGQGGWTAGCTVLGDLGLAQFGDLAAILNPDETQTSCVAHLATAPFYGSVSATVVYDASGARGDIAPASLTLVDTVSDYQLATIILSRTSGSISVRTRGSSETVGSRSGFTILDIRAELFGDGMQRIYLDGALAYEGLSVRPDDPAINLVSFSSGTSSLVIDNITLTDINGGGCPGDFTGDDAVDSADLATLLAAWGPCP